MGVDESPKTSGGIQHTVMLRHMKRFFFAETS